MENLGRLTNPCTKHTAKVATFDVRLNIPSGISGYRASRFSLYMNSSENRHPNMIRQITCGESHENVTPPKSSPRSSISVRPRIEKHPNQSIALAPSTIFVRGLCTSRKSRRRTKVSPETGRLSQ